MCFYRFVSLQVFVKFDFKVINVKVTNFVSTWSMLEEVWISHAHSRDVTSGRVSLSTPDTRK